MSKQKDRARLVIEVVGREGTMAMESKLPLWNANGISKQHIVVGGGTIMLIS